MDSDEHLYWFVLKFKLVKSRSSNTLTPDSNRDYELITFKSITYTSLAASVFFWPLYIYYSKATLFITVEFYF